MKGLICPKCNSQKQDPKYEKDLFFVCSDCGNVIGYDCLGCEKFYDENRLGLHGDVYECKLCGRIQWGYTEYIRNKKGESR